MTGFTLIIKDAIQLATEFTAGMCVLREARQHLQFVISAGIALSTQLIMKFAMMVLIIILGAHKIVKA